MVFGKVFFQSPELNYERSAFIGGAVNEVIKEVVAFIMFANGGNEQKVIEIETGKMPGIYFLTGLCEVKLVVPHQTKK